MCREVILRDLVLVEILHCGEGGDVEQWLEPRNRSSVFTNAFSHSLLTHSLLLHANIVLFHIAVYTFVPLLLGLRLLLASLLEIVFNFALFAITYSPPLGDLQLVSEPNP